MQTVQLLDDMNIAYSTFDILTDESVRQGRPISYPYV